MNMSTAFASAAENITVAERSASGRDARERGLAPRLFVQRYWLTLLFALLWAVPPLVTLARRVWTTEQGAQGPLILCTGLWALGRESRYVTGSSRGQPALVLSALMLAICAYLLGGMISAVSLQFAAAYLGLIALLYDRVGFAGMRRLWFPLLYLTFLIPLPAPIINWLTGALKLWISGASVDLLGAAGFEVARSNNSLFIDGYELLVEAACSGLNSIVSLLAVGLFYAYVRGRGWGDAILLGLMIVPIAILANLVRVLLLLLLVHYWGAGMLETFLHEGAGLLMFLFALAGLYVVDQALSPILRRVRGR
jgi:exosortase